jgi:hypothetical protein
MDEEDQGEDEFIEGLSKGNKKGEEFEKMTKRQKMASLAK